MPAALPVYMPWLMTAGFGWLYYRRIRRHFGWQPWRPVRNGIRIGILTLVSAALVAAAIYIPHVAWGIVAGAVAGLGLGVFALKHTLISPRDGRAGYTPNPWIGGGLALLLVLVSWRVSAAVALLALGVYLSLLNRAPESPYFAQTLQLWEQGRFIRFNGLAQWVGWLWPYVASLYLLGQIARRDTKT